MHTEPNNPGVDAPEATDFSGDAQLQLELEQLRIAMGNIRDEALRERAELDNQRKRLARDVEQARKFANERLLGADVAPINESG